MFARVVDQQLIQFPLIAEVLLRRLTLVNDLLQVDRPSLPHDLPADDAASLAIDCGQDVGFVFFSPMKVNSSSNSTVSFSAGWGVAGKLAAWALTQFATLWGLTPRCRPIRRRLLPSTYNCRA